MDKRQPKCFHNGIILIVNCFHNAILSILNKLKMGIFPVS
jgi:hypothetical protein